MNPNTTRRGLRAVLPLAALAAVAVLAAPAYADPPNSGAGSESGTGGGKAMIVAAKPLPDQTPVDSVTGRTVAGMPSLSDRDPWPDPPDIVIGPSPNPPEGPKATS